MAYVTVTGIGPAERRVVELILDDITVADRTTTENVKRLRKQFDLRGLRTEIDDLTEQEKKRLIDLGTDPSLLRGVPGITWSTLKEAGYDRPETGGDEFYGQSYKVDRATLIWLQEKRTKKEMWVWREVQPDTPTAPVMKEALPISVEMLDAIATLDEAMDLVLRESPAGDV